VTKIVRSLALMTAMAGLITAGGLAVAPAQDKKDVKKGTKAAAGTVEVNEGKDGKFRFFVRDAEGKMLAMSGPSGFETKADAVEAIETLKSVLPSAKMSAGKKDDKSKDDKKDPKKDDKSKDK